MLLDLVPLRPNSFSPHATIPLSRWRRRNVRLFRCACGTCLASLTSRLICYFPPLQRFAFPSETGANHMLKIQSGIVQTEVRGLKQPVRGCFWRLCCYRGVQSHLAGWLEADKADFLLLHITGKDMMEDQGRCWSLYHKAAVIHRQYLH